MKTAHPQKGLSPIVVVITLAVLGIGAFVLYNSKVSQNPQSTNQQISNNQQTQTSSESIPGLEKIETDAYTFYYPKEYVKTNKELQKSNGIEVAQLYLKDNTSKLGQGVRLSIVSMTTRPKTPTDESCRLLSKFATRGMTNPTIVDARPVDYIKSHACIIWYLVTDSNNIKWNRYEKYISYKEGSDINSYELEAAYLSDTPQDEQEKMRLAVDSFKLK